MSFVKCCSPIKKKPASPLSKQLEGLAANWDAYSQSDRLLDMEKALVEGAQQSVDATLRDTILSAFPTDIGEKKTAGDVM